MSRALLFAFILPLLVVAQSSDQPSGLPPAGYNGGTDNPQNPSDAGAEGASKGAFALSNGALAAIIVVAVVVVVAGIASATLWWLAKKRQWDIRASIRRASRRLTGRGPSSNKQDRQKRGTGLRLDSPPLGKNNKLNRDRDLEKGLPPSTKDPQTTATITSVQR